MREVARYAKITNLCFEVSIKEDVGSGGGGGAVLLLRRSRSSKPPLDRYSYTRQPAWEQAPINVDILTRVRHPNLITLIGACSQAGGLVYEYLSNGGLEDRLLRSSTAPPPPPLTWRDRVRIAGQIYSALFFLHSARPYTIVHGDLKPANILLDANLIAKIGDFGISRLLPHQESAATICRLTDPKGTYAYVNPQFMTTGELTAKSNVYAFGVIILQLLTAKPGSRLANAVKKALSSKKLHEILDPAVGKWPSKEAMQLANLGLICCELERKNRPDLESDVWKLAAAANGPSVFCNSFVISGKRMK
ncbi:Dual specificity mitogen-activated protein kinase kinase 1 [Nymphaea thermarum]|nr:Dual specificity mitogen-activated protein kinase kinase 1 [Nymphaea thermarum]